LAQPKIHKIKPGFMKLSGIIPPMVTPLCEPDKLDEAGLEHLIEHMLAGGVHGLFALGTTGEGPALSYCLRRALVQHTCQLVRKRVPVLACVSDTSYAESIHLARHAAECGADAIVAAPPFYWAMQHCDLDHYFERLASESPLPLLLYNMPGLTKISIPVETVGRALSHPNIIGMKDSSGSLPYLHRLLRVRDERHGWPVFVGDEETLAYAVLAGADGGVSGGANVFPQLYVRLYQAAQQNDKATISRLHSVLLRVSDLYRIGRGTIPIISGIKHALEILGICKALTSTPFKPFGESQRAEVEKIVQDVLHLLA
jgi:4-hydroxy-tetrahydrodipicolinate synthase